MTSYPQATQSPVLVTGASGHIASGRLRCHPMQQTREQHFQQLIDDGLLKPRR